MVAAASSSSAPASPPPPASPAAAASNHPSPETSSVELRSTKIVVFMISALGAYLAYRVCSERVRNTLTPLSLSLGIIYVLVGYEENPIHRLASALFGKRQSNDTQVNNEPGEAKGPRESGQGAGAGQPAGGAGGGASPTSSTSLIGEGAGAGQGGGTVTQSALAANDGDGPGAGAAANGGDDNSSHIEGNLDRGAISFLAKNSNQNNES